MYTVLFECTILCEWEHSNKLIWSIYLELWWLILVKCMYFPHFSFQTINWKKHNLKHFVKIALRMVSCFFFFLSFWCCSIELQCIEMNALPQKWIYITYNFNNILLSKMPSCITMNCFMYKETILVSPELKRKEMLLFLPHHFNYYGL